MDFKLNMEANIVNRKTEPIVKYDLTYGMGQECDLGLFLQMVTYVNAGFQDERINHDILTGCTKAMNKSIKEKIDGCKSQVKPVAFTLVRRGHGNLGLYGNVEEDGKLELKLWDRGVSLGHEAEKWILKYGRDEESQKELKEKLGEEFGEDLNKDYNYFQKGLMEFFLKNLHLLKK